MTKEWTWEGKSREREKRTEEKGSEIWWNRMLREKSFRLRWDGISAASPSSFHPASSDSRTLLISLLPLHFFPLLPSYVTQNVNRLFSLLLFFYCFAVLRVPSVLFLLRSFRLLPLLCSKVNSLSNCQQKISQISLACSGHQKNLESRETSFKRRIRKLELEEMKERTEKSSCLLWLKELKRLTTRGMFFSNISTFEWCFNSSQHHTDRRTLNTNMYIA